jgi:hypothetical protein
VCTAIHSRIALLNEMHAQINVMLKNLPESEFGPQIDFREYSFLQNPSLPKHVSFLLLSNYNTINWIVSFGIIKK